VLETAFTVEACWRLKAEVRVGFEIKLIFSPFWSSGVKIKFSSADCNRMSQAALTIGFELTNEALQRPCEQWLKTTQHRQESLEVGW